MAIVNSAAMNIVYKFLFQHQFIIFLSIYLRVELLDHLILLFITFCGTTKLLSTVAVLCYIPTSNVEGFQFVCILPNTCCLLFVFIIVILVGVK